MSAIKLDCYVRTADGTIGYVNVLDKDSANVVVDANGTSIELPLAELRRVPDPYNKRPPVEHMPADRPRCQYCDRPMPFWTRDTYGPINGPHGTRRRIVRRMFERWRDNHGEFCRASCAFKFARAALRAGYRIQRKG